MARLVESKRLRELYYITHINNVESILERGILSHHQMETLNVKYTPIYDKQIVTGRKKRKAPNGHSLWKFANLFFQARNPMLYRVVLENGPENLAVLGVRRDILNSEDAFIVNGNAASQLSDIVPRDGNDQVLKDIIWDVDRTWWHEEDGSKRRIMAECLIPDTIHPDYIQTVFVANENSRQLLMEAGVEAVVPHPSMFFQPSREIRVTPSLRLLEGDMFFSRLQTLTVSVNCVGIMGKGLASRAKYQFPDTYVYYQDLCRKKKLVMGKPALYKRETSFDYQLSDQPISLKNHKAATWFLLFPTKNHWRYRSDIHGIEKGLAWVRDNYRKEGITSLAIPALGCGLGRLDWKDVGPLMYRYLSPLAMDIDIYLPAEKKIHKRYLSIDFLGSD